MPLFSPAEPPQVCAPNSRPSPEAPRSPSATGTEVRRDLAQYEAAGLRAFHIDRGWKQDELVAFAREENLPYYVDHAADKGLLHLTERTGVKDILNRPDLLARPVSLSDPAVIATLKDHLAKNVATTKEGPVLAYSFDDEISLASFNSPSEVDDFPRRWPCITNGSRRSTTGSKPSTPPGDQCTPPSKNAAPSPSRSFGPSTTLRPFPWTLKALRASGSLREASRPS